MQKKWMNNPELFCSELLKGYLWQLFVGERFRLMGYEVCVPQMSYKGLKHAKEYLNSRDLTVNGKIVEVKSRNYKFTSQDDFPFPTILIETKSGFEGKKDRPVMYVSVCQQNGAMCALDVKKTYNQWSAVKIYDRVRKVSSMTFQCEKGLWESVDSAAEHLIGPASDKNFGPTSVFGNGARWSPSDE